MEVLLRQNRSLILGSIGAVAVLILVRRFFGSPKSKPERKKGVVYFHSLPPAWRLPASSPFCSKLEYYLRYNKIPFEIVLDRPGPKSKWPYIEWNGETLADSTLIIDRLNKDFNVNLDLDLSKEEKSISLAFQRLIEEHAFFAMVYFRWVVHWKQTKEVYFISMPCLLNWWFLITLSNRKW